MNEKLKENSLEQNKNNIIFILIGVAISILMIALCGILETMLSIITSIFLTIIVLTCILTYSRKSAFLDSLSEVIMIYTNQLEQQNHKEILLNQKIKNTGDLIWICFMGIYLMFFI